MEPGRKYDAALSFAGEDRDYVSQVARALREAGLEVFYDDYEKVDLWGKNLYTHLRDVYQHRAEYTIIFISEHYARKLWTNHERESAQARAFEESREYILPVRFDDAQIPGDLKTTSYLDLRGMPPIELAQAILTKLGRHPPLSRVDADPAPQQIVRDYGEPVLVYRLPRGFLVLDRISTEPHGSWSVGFDHYGYDGSWKHSTHYHESYREWWERSDGIESQFQKLMIPEADWLYAYTPIQLGRDIRHGRMFVTRAGETTRDGDPVEFDDYKTAIYADGKVPRQQPPHEYVGLGLTGGVRDILQEISAITKPTWKTKQDIGADFVVMTKRIRRQARIEIHKLFPSDHPARMNVEELVSELPGTASVDDMQRWLREMEGALHEASWEIRRQHEPETGAT